MIEAVAGALDGPTVMRSDGRVDQIAAETAKAHEGSVLVGARQAGLYPTTSDTRIAASLRVSLITPLLKSPH